ncbi:13860_t:CDS:1 [Acaulospora colombiana]|uniref:13860_t:CDS:1 n=1 Tax=Acaulospora colombiana TaxID=27376 RepID=A0ACA9LU32_9GLOM|nr:13860_t:CDS:1 [Acaulospora colombiana]
MPCSGSIPLPTQTSRWTVIKGPFVHKKSQENFERKTHKRFLIIKDTNREVVERWLWYLTKSCPAGVGMRVTLWEWEKLGVGKEMLQNASGKKRRMLKDVESTRGVDVRDVVVEVANALVKDMEKELVSETDELQDKNSSGNDEMRLNDVNKENEDGGNKKDEK